MRSIFVLTAALLAVPAGAESSKPEDAKACTEALSRALVGPSIDAADKYLACAQVPGQTAYKIAQSRFNRLQMLEQLDKRELAEAELVALTTAPISTFPVFTNAASGFVIIGGEHSIGYTQVDLLAARANYRLFVQDNAGALNFANRAIAMAGYDPALVLDAAPAFVVRARLAYAEKNTDMTVKHAIRAYLRGSQDPMTLEVLTNLPAESQDQLKKLRQHMNLQISGYAYAITAHARVSQKPEDVARAIKDAKAAAAGLEQFELSQLGPL